MVDNTTCQKCTEPVNEDAFACPHCGFEPRKQGHRTRQVKTFLGVILTMSVIGAIFGVPLLITAYYEGYKAKKRRPTNYNPA